MLPDLAINMGKLKNCKQSQIQFCSMIASMYLIIHNTVKCMQIHNKHKDIFVSFKIHFIFSIGRVGTLFSMKVTNLFYMIEEYISPKNTTESYFSKMVY